MRLYLGLMCFGLTACTSNTIELDDASAGDTAAAGTGTMGTGGSTAGTRPPSDGGPVTTASPPSPTAGPVDTGDSTADAGEFPLPPTLAPDGRYLMVLDPTFSPGLPLQWEVNASAEALSFAGQSLTLDVGSSTVPRELIGGIWEGAVTMNNQEITIVVPALQILPEANPATGAEATTSVLTFEGISDGGGFFCGTVLGDVVLPVAVPLQGSTFALIPVAPGQPWPQDFPLGC